MYDMVRHWREGILGAGLVIAGLALTGLALSPVAEAEQPLTSTNYRFEESVLGGGGLQQSSSSSYQFTSTLGENAVGPSSSAGFQNQAGNKTSPDPVLGFAVTNGNVNFGQFSPTSGTVASANFAVSNYTSYGYVVQMIGSTPATTSGGGHTIPAMGTSTPADPVIGTEQFGINLVANTLPVSIGANPNQGQFGFGVAAANYNTTNKYRFVSGETIASAPKSSGVTNYTIAYVVNVGNLTTGGIYTANQTLVCTGTF